MASCCSAFARCSFYGTRRFVDALSKKQSAMTSSSASESSSSSLFIRTKGNSKALRLSQIGIGTYRGDVTDAEDTRVIASIITAMEGFFLHIMSCDITLCPALSCLSHTHTHTHTGGVNVVDTASNYRNGRGEKFCV